MKKHLLIKIIFFLCLFFTAKFSYAQSLISDGETEKFLFDISAPIFDAANLEKENIKIYIVNDNSINAFVALGQNIFINTGLIRKYQTPDTLIGVIAHEVGHIKGGHLARFNEGSEGANRAMLLSSLLGVAAIAAGAPDAGTALILGGSQSAQRLFMKYTRTQEEAADQYAIKYLKEISYPADGLIKLLQFFDREMIAYKDQIDEYLLSHPVSKKRIDLLKDRTRNWNFSNKKTNQSVQQQMSRVLAKLEGFIDNPDFILEKYRLQNNENANYAKSIALYRLGKINESLFLLNPIIQNNPSDGFLLELKAQILAESGQLQNSVLLYSEALKLIPRKFNNSTKIAFASTILAIKTSDLELVNLAIKNLLEAQNSEKENPSIYKQLAIAYNKKKQQGKSYLALANYHFLIGEKEKAEKYAKEAKENLEKDDKINQLIIQDLLNEIKEDKK
jgi:predicted Zn-dependent protease